MKDLCDSEGIKKAIEEFNSQKASQDGNQPGMSTGQAGEGFIPQHLVEALEEIDEGNCNTLIQMQNAVLSNFIYFQSLIKCLYFYF